MFKYLKILVLACTFATLAGCAGSYWGPADSGVYHVSSYNYDSGVYHVGHYHGPWHRHYVRRHYRRGGGGVYPVSGGGGHRYVKHTASSEHKVVRVASQNTYSMQGLK